jgi:uronate dehydrogenase
MEPTATMRTEPISHPRNVLLTGASGNLGRVLVPALAEAGHRLTLTDRTPFPDPLPRHASFFQADLTEQHGFDECPADVTDIVHFGGINTEGPPEAIHAANIMGTLHVFQLARARGARVIFASSNHTIGFYPRSRALTVADAYRPDGYYGLSKAYAELLGRLFYDKHGVESVHLRIASCVPEPTDLRHLSTWLSYPDFVRLVDAAVTAKAPGFAIVWGVSRNTRRWWSEDDAERIGYWPQDDAETFASQIHSESGGAVSLTFQGGSHCAMGFSRTDFEQE